MKEKLLLHILPSDRWTVAERYALDILLHFRNEGWETVAATREAMTIDRRLRRLGFSILNTPLRGWLDLPTLLPLIKCMRRRPSYRHIVVHTHTLRDALTAAAARRLCFRRDIRIMLTHHQPLPPPSGRWERRLFQSIDTHITAAKELIDPALLPDAIILPYSVNTDSAAPPPMPEAGPVSMAYKGELARGHGLETLIDALPLTLPQKPRLIIAGYGNPDYLDRLRRRAQLRGVMERIDWMRDSDNPFAALGQAHFGVFPSSSSMDTIDRLDFMAAGRTYIRCADTPTLPFIISADCSTPALLAENIRRLAADRQLAGSLGEEARGHFRQSHSWQNFISTLSAAYLPPFSIS